MAGNLLIHSMAEFHSITLSLLECIQAKTIAEIGSEHGGNSKLLYDWSIAHDATLLSIDPEPSKDFYQWLASTHNNVKHIKETSFTAIPQCSQVDAWFVDGDHNWYTVFNELKLIRKSAVAQQKMPVIFLHDVGWPWARRDLYYAPDRIPKEFQQPHTWNEGVTLDNDLVVNGGFRSHGAFAIAKRAGGERNGVLTAVEDFLAAHSTEYCFGYIPAVFGLGVIFNAAHPQAEEIAAIIKPFHCNPLLETLELNRLRNYLAVIEWQDKSKQPAARLASKTPA